MYVQELNCKLCSNSKLCSRTVSYTFNFSISLVIRYLHVANARLHVANAVLLVANAVLLVANAVLLVANAVLLVANAVLLVANFSQNQKDLVVLSRQCCLFCLLKS